MVSGSNGPFVLGKTRQGWEKGSVPCGCGSFSLLGDYILYDRKATFCMVSRSARCELCYEIVDENAFEVWEDRSVYCHNPDWVIPGGTCWEKRVVEDVPEMEPWLWLAFECDGCEVDEETGECTCTSGF